MTHTWDTSVRYVRCPECGYIIESRQKFKREDNREVKEVLCPRCGKEFTAEKPVHTRIRGKPEFDWS